MVRLTLTRRIHFSAAHRYRRPEWDDLKNTQVFGKCARPNYHGHTYVCDVTVTGQLDQSTGFIVDLGLLDQILKQCVLEQLDHTNLNMDIPEFAEGNKIPSTEELACWIANTVDSKLLATSSARVYRVKVAEEPGLWATWESE